LIYIACSVTGPRPAATYFKTACVPTANRNINHSANQPGSSRRDKKEEEATQLKITNRKRVGNNAGNSLGRTCEMYTVLFATASADADIISYLYTAMEFTCSGEDDRSVRTTGVFWSL